MGQRLELAADAPQLRDAAERQPRTPQITAVMTPARAAADSNGSSQSGIGMATRLHRPGCPVARPPVLGYDNGNTPETAPCLRCRCSSPRPATCAPTPTRPGRRPSRRRRPCASPPPSPRARGRACCTWARRSWTPPLPPALGYFRELGAYAAGPGLPAGRARAGAGRRRAGPGRGHARPPAAEPAAHARRRIRARPIACARWWAATRQALLERVAAQATTVEAVLRAASPVWSAVGRVHFHLAENRGIPSARSRSWRPTPTGSAERGKVQHAPLGQALRRIRRRPQPAGAAVAAVAGRSGGRAAATG